MAIPYAGTQIAGDGKRYTIGQTASHVAVPRKIPEIYGTPAGAQVIWFNPTTQRAEWVNLDRVEDFFPLSS